ncbi:hypothetical protein N658DRAFT_156430 [Parathielavia hyrcaniae]|uniref:Uncharacterized protein n=1 Tax=Parathielavia hyrcaniae TaxID=113614 RepID=A0AAN6Q280_9PEZI|nr:hypothetical protein N658DRAFT_156430 [Parathielavia hyrcaniae]
MMCGRTEYILLISCSRIVNTCLTWCLRRSEWIHVVLSRGWLLTWGRERGNAVSGDVSRTCSSEGRRNKWPFVLPGLCHINVLPVYPRLAISLNTQLIHVSKWRLNLVLGMLSKKKHTPPPTLYTTRTLLIQPSNRKRQRLPETQKRLNAQQGTGPSDLMTLRKFKLP